MNLVLCIDESSNDYYVGDDSAIYINGSLKWHGYSADQVESILDAVLAEVGEGTYEVRKFERPRGYQLWPDLLTDVKARSELEHRHGVITHEHGNWKPGHWHLDGLAELVKPAIRQ